MSPVNKLISNKLRLPSPPAIAIKILETVRKDDFTFQDLAGVIESDPALTLRILKASNSPYYIQSGNVTSIEKSLAILGTHRVMNIALSFIICSEFQCEPYGTFDATIFWRRAVSSAVAAELAAKLIGSADNNIFISAMLQDIGIMVMHNCRPLDYQLVLNSSKNSRRPLLEAERTIFKCDHQEVGAELLKSWLLPEGIYEPIRYHHKASSAPPKYLTHTKILSIAADLSAFYNNSNDVNKIRQIKHVFDTEFGIQGSAVDDLIESVGSKTLEVLSSFDIAPGMLRPFSQILQEANEGLSQLYDSYELQVIELKQVKQKLEEQAKELNAVNIKLQDLASRDGLTGIYNYRMFHDSLDAEISRSQRYGGEFSLIFFDIDHFKKINDVYGHPVGDLVLVEICMSLGKVIRSSDIFARCGGDEFAIIMPETNKNNAIVVAEYLRACIEKLAIRENKEIIKVRISIGLASYDKTMDKEKIIQLADNALIKAKHDGKNKIFAM